MTGKGVPAPDSSPKLSSVPGPWDPQLTGVLACSGPDLFANFLRPERAEPERWVDRLGLFQRAGGLAIPKIAAVGGGVGPRVRMKE